MRHLICAGFIAIILGGCINDPETDPTYTLPLSFTIGNKWEYESSSIIIKPDQKVDTIRDTNHLFMSITGTKTSQAGFPVFEFKDSSSGIISYDYYEKKDDGLYLYASTDAGIHALWKSFLQSPDVVLKEPPVLFVPASFKSGDEWVCDTLVTDHEQIVLKRVFRGIEKVITKAGTFACYKFETSGYLKEKRFHYFYQGIGLVKKVVVIDSLPITDANFNILGYETCVSENLLVSAN